MTFDLVVKSGETLSPKGKEGLASLTASLLDEGTKTRTALQLAGELAEIGATLGAAGDLESTTVSLTTLTRHLDRALDLYADVAPESVVSRQGVEPAQAASGWHSSRPAPTTPSRPPEPSSRG